MALQKYLQPKVEVPPNLGELHDRYRTAAPFPHIALDNLFSPSFLDRVLAEASQLKADQWINVEQDHLEKTLRMRSAVEVGDAGAELIALLHSAAFLYLLSEITGIWQLLPDPYLQGAGHASMHRGDYFKVHADRNIAYDTGLTRRLAMIIFLNKDWPADYGGRLELWNPEGTRCETAIEPVFNRTAIFEVAYPNYHGVPEPLTCPPDRTRHSFLVYYHTAGGGAGDKVKPHTSRFAPQFYRKQKSLLRRTLDQITPPIIVSAVSAARKLVRGR
ncbi:MAG TPA: 2OG-Fe(II) oxygenase [Povalibacter sp.]